MTKFAPQLLLAPPVQFCDKKAHTCKFRRLSGKSSVFPRCRVFRRKADPLSKEDSSGDVAGSSLPPRGGCGMAIARGDSDRRLSRPGAILGLAALWTLAGHGDGALPPRCGLRGKARVLKRAALSIRRPWPQPDPPIGRRNVRSVCSRSCGATNPHDPPNGEVLNLASDLNQSQTVSLANGATLTVREWTYAHVK